jgi:hypothetical protein
MAIPVINTTTSILAYKQWEVWAYQPYATNSPTSWSSGPLAPGLTLDAVTGKITGRGEVPGVYLAELIATNVNGASAPLVLTIGIEPASVTPDSKHEMAIDLGSGQVSLLSYSVQSPTSQPTGAPLISVKEDDDLLLRILFLKGGNVIDLDLTSLKFAVKELEPESVLVLSTPTFEKQGTGSNAGFLLHVKFNGDLLASSLSNYEEEGGTFFDALAELEWVQTNTETIGPVELRRSSATFRVRIERDLIP